MVKKRDVLIQNSKDLTYVGLCKGDAFQLKMQVEGEFHEVVIIEKNPSGGYDLTIKEPLNPSKQTYQWVEECFYHMIPQANKLTRPEQEKVIRYFGEDY